MGLGLFKRRVEKSELLKNKVHKIMNESEEKRDFMPLFDFNLPKIMDEKERKSCLMETAKKYFEIKQKIIKENKKIS